MRGGRAEGEGGMGKKALRHGQQGPLVGPAGFVRSLKLVLVT